MRAQCRCSTTLPRSPLPRHSAKEKDAAGERSLVRPPCSSATESRQQFFIKSSVPECGCTHLQIRLRSCCGPHPYVAPDQRFACLDGEWLRTVAYGTRRRSLKCWFVGRRPAHPPKALPALWLCSSCRGGRLPSDILAHPEHREEHTRPAATTSPDLARLWPMWVCRPAVPGGPKITCPPAAARQHSGCCCGPACSLRSPVATR